jgi:alanine racemase
MLFSKKTSIINVENLKWNLDVIRKNLPPNTEIMGVVKANAYGHGLVPFSKALINNKVNKLAVDNLSEGKILRDHNIKQDILILSYTPIEFIDEVINYNLIQSISNINDIYKIRDRAKKLQKEARVHINLNTGLNRDGITPDLQSIKNIMNISEDPWIKIEGIYTHLANRDDEIYTRMQIDKFNEFIGYLKKRNVKIDNFHVYSSSSIFRSNLYHYNIVRIGAALYGLQSGFSFNELLRPVMSVHTTITNLIEVDKNQTIGYSKGFVTNKKSLIATVPIGFGDGYPRGLSNKSYVLVNGYKAPIVGNICLNNFMIDVTGIRNVKIGNKVTLIGEQNDVYITADELAEKVGTINTEIIHNLGLNSYRICKGTRSESLV